MNKSNGHLMFQPLFKNTVISLLSSPIRVLIRDGLNLMGLVFCYLFIFFKSLY